MNKKIWLVTGISSGLGKAITQTVMEKGDFVIGTFRQQNQVNEFNTNNSNNGYALKMDITKLEEVEASITRVNEKFGKIDVLINNAGFGLAGSVEETSIAEVRTLFEANFIGALTLTQKVLPILRQQKKGHIIQISSHGGFKAFAGFGIYNASKFALEGFSEALAQEVAPLGIKVTIVQPGPFRTKFAGKGFTLAKTEIADYKETAGVFRKKIKGVDGKQEGDPVKAANTIYNIVNSENPPLRLPLGKIAIRTLSAKIASVQQDIDNYRDVAESVVF